MSSRLHAFALDTSRCPLSRLNTEIPCEAWRFGVQICSKDSRAPGDTDATKDHADAVRITCQAFLVAGEFTCIYYLIDRGRAENMKFQLNPDLTAVGLC